MTKIISAGTCSAIVAAATISVLAQNPPSQPPQQNPPPQTTTTSAEPRITVTGCLKPARAGATDTAGVPGTAGTTGATVPSTAPSDSANATFILADATISPATGDTATTA